jgi:hypothetical protein
VDTKPWVSDIADLTDETAIPRSQVVIDYMIPQLEEKIFFSAVLLEPFKVHFLTHGLATPYVVHVGLQACRLGESDKTILTFHFFRSVGVTSSGR